MGRSLAGATSSPRTPCGDEGDGPAQRPGPGYLCRPQGPSSLASCPDPRQGVSPRLPVPPPTPRPPRGAWRALQTFRVQNQVLGPLSAPMTEGGLWDSGRGQGIGPRGPIGPRVLHEGGDSRSDQGSVRLLPHPSGVANNKPLWGRTTWRETACTRSSLRRRSG